MSRTTLWRIFYLTALMGLVVALMRERESSRATSRNWDLYRDQLSRLRSIDELTGNQLPPLGLTTLDGRSVQLGAVGAWRPIWVLDPDRCASCLDQVSRWNSAVGLLKERPLLVLVGVDADRARLMREELGIRLDVYTANADFRISAGMRMPSTYLYLDEQGIVLLADAHSTHTSCEWSFPVQVATIAKRGNVGRALRPTAITQVQED